MRLHATFGRCESFLRRADVHLRIVYLGSYLGSMVILKHDMRGSVNLGSLLRGSL